MSTPCGFIDDGYTEDFDIPEVPGESVGIKGKYRPITRKELLRIHSLPGSTPDESDAAEDAICELVASHIVSWNLKTIKSKAVPVDAVNLGRIHPPRLLSQLIDTVCGMDAKYVSPQAIRLIADDEKTDAKVRIARIKELFAGIPKPGQTEATDAKN